MADIALNAVTAVSPAPQKSSREQQGADAAQDPNSFASVLKERSASQNASSSSSSASAPAKQPQAKPANASENRAPAEESAAPEALAEADGKSVEAMLAALLGLPTENADSSAETALAVEAAIPVDPAQVPVDPALQAAIPIAAPVAAPANAAAPAASLAADDDATATPDLLAGQTGGDALNDAAQPAHTPVGNTPSQEPVITLSDQDASQRSSIVLKDNAFGDALAAAQRSAGQTAVQQVNTAPQQPSAEVPQHIVRTPVGQAGWADEVGQRVGWVANRDSGRAELVLTPPSMGRVEVSINMNGDQASASFVAANPVAREALQDALPRLREMLAQAGITLTQADVGAGQQGQAQSGGHQGQGNRGNGFAGMGMTEGSNTQVANSTLGRIQSGRGLVDIFA